MTVVRNTVCANKEVIGGLPHIALIFRVSHSGWMTKELLSEWFRIPQQGLVMDGHTSCQSQLIPWAILLQGL